MMIQEYFNRINYNAGLEPTLEHLKILQKQHLLTVPFENLDIHRGETIVLDLKQIYQKVIHNHRGGFCYELNGLFGALLKEIGFNVHMISARVYGNGNYGPEYDHLALLVKIADKEYLVDVGFGEFTFGPLLVEKDQEQLDERGYFVIKARNDDYLMAAKIENNQKLVPQYIFKREARQYAEFESMCHYHQTSEASHFTKKKLITLPTENGRITITGNRLKIRKGDVVQEKTIEALEWEAVINDYFGVKY